MGCLHYSQIITVSRIRSAHSVRVHVSPCLRVQVSLFFPLFNTHAGLRWHADRCWVFSGHILAAFICRQFSPLSWSRSGVNGEGACAYICIILTLTCLKWVLWIVLPRLLYLIKLPSESAEEETVCANRLSAEIHPVIHILFNSPMMLYLLIKSRDVHLNIYMFLRHANFIDSQILNLAVAARGRNARTARLATCEHHHSTSVLSRWHLTRGPCFNPSWVMLKHGSAPPGQITFTQLNWIEMNLLSLVLFYVIVDHLSF